MIEILEIMQSAVIAAGDLMICIVAVTFLYLLAMEVGL